MNIINMTGFKKHNCMDVIEYFYNMVDGCHFLWEGRNKLPTISMDQLKSREIPELVNKEMLYQDQDLDMKESEKLLLMLTYMFTEEADYVAYVDGFLTKSKIENATYEISCTVGYDGLIDILSAGQSNVSRNNIDAGKFVIPATDQNAYRYNAKMDIDKNEVYLYAEGGGYILRCIPNVTDLNKYRVTEFKNVYIDTYAYLKTDKVYKCKADPNELVYGWAVPYFTLETAMQILIDSAKYIIVTINVLEDNRYEYIIVNKDQLLDQHDYKKMEYTSLIQGKDELKDLYKFEKWSWTISDSVAK